MSKNALLAFCGFFFQPQQKWLTSYLNPVYSCRNCLYIVLNCFKLLFKAVANFWKMSSFFKVFFFKFLHILNLRIHCWLTLSPFCSSFLWAYCCLLFAFISCITFHLICKSVRMQRTSFIGCQLMLIAAGSEVKNVQKEHPAIVNTLQQNNGS